MLVLARQLHERILIPVVDTAIEVVAIRPGSVRLGIDAPSDVLLLREEVLRRHGAEPDPRPLTAAGAEPALRKRLHNVLLGLSQLRQQARTLPCTDLAGSVEQVMQEVVLLSRQVNRLLADDDESVGSGLAI
jgi:carbon storage regulator CsrA